MTVRMENGTVLDVKNLSARDPDYPSKLRKLLHEGWTINYSGEWIVTLVRIARHEYEPHNQFKPLCKHCGGSEKFHLHT